MSRRNIDGNIILTFDWDVSEKYWPRLSEIIAKKYGTSLKTEHAEVEAILQESFAFFVNEFETLVRREKSLSLKSAGS